MPDVRYWNDEQARDAWMEKGRQVFARLQGELAGQSGVIAVDPESGAYWVAPTLCQANDAAYPHNPDRWLYFCRLDDPDAEILLPTW